MGRALNGCCGGLLVSMVLFALPVNASVTGKVTDSTGTTVAGATVTFTEELNSDNQYSDITDDTGNYEIDLTGPTIVSENVPAAFKLGQNYPNPFNPKTTIPFTLESSTHISLIIYNIMGQKVATVIDNYLDAGSHAVTWNGTDNQGNHVSAGVYLYRLKTGRYAGTKKMLLLDGGGGSGVGASNAAKSAYNSGMQNAAKIAGGATYTVTIIHDSIIPYEETGVSIADGQTLDFVVTLKDDTVIQDLTFVSIPEVKEPYIMNPDDDGTYSVTLSAYEMSATEVTNAQYAGYLNQALVSGDITATSSRVNGTSGDWNGKEYINLAGYSSTYPDFDCKIVYSDESFSVKSGYENWPVIWITWYGSKAFAEYYGFDLPTEAEWQYAASGGMNYEHGTDDGTINSSNANYNDNIGHLTDAGSYPANPFGLYDMNGNVYEWCNDWFGSYPRGVVNNPTGPQSSVSRVIRGGSLSNNANFCKTASRTNYYPQNKGAGVGFRVVRHFQPPKVTMVSIPEVTTSYIMNPDDGGTYSVTLSTYEMSATEITNAQYAEYLNSALVSGDIEVKNDDVYEKIGDLSGQRFLDIGYGSGDNMCWINYSNSNFSVESGKENCPVVAVTWYGSKAFAEYYGFDLPTEAEWQYAASGGMNYEYGTDDGTINSSNANYDVFVIGHPTDAGSYPANPCGLYDMSGNVYEWCSDWYGIYPSGTANNPTGAQSGSSSVRRGGSWTDEADGCSLAKRDYSDPSSLSGNLGFRVVSR